jgi:hypothetical protein
MAQMKRAINRILLMFNKEVIVATLHSHTTAMKLLLIKHLAILSKFNHAILSLYLWGPIINKIWLQHHTAKVKCNTKVNTWNFHFNNTDEAV